MQHINIHRSTFPYQYAKEWESVDVVGGYRDCDGRSAGKGAATCDDDDNTGMLGAGPLGIEGRTLVKSMGELRDPVGVMTMGRPLASLV